MQGAEEGIDDKQFVSILADSFWYNNRDDYMLKHITNVVCNAACNVACNIVCNIPTGVEEYMNETLNFIANPQYEKSCKLHEQYQKQYLVYYNTNPGHKLESGV